MTSVAISAAIARDDSAIIPRTHRMSVRFSARSESTPAHGESAELERLQPVLTQPSARAEPAIS
jgi:hypothetical protein